MSNPVFSRHFKQNDLNQLIVLIEPFLKVTPILLLKGDLGAGKTTFTQSLLQSLGVSKTVSSPTFNIVNEYQTNSGESIYHFDLYRIKHVVELEEMGFEDYLESGNICLIEWPGIAEDIVSQYPTLLMEIAHTDNEERKYSVFMN
ncbi:MAG: tRNA (adenosine(37)-N6)-threonylcarbamoyltransferase complex ATPase subunit type 1 TsaE [Bacteroidota bacterium]|nr:tRNA (adenosine(37)-N6)-threonylcarbamoyltransferase complex ATPase subunit type 1 TsaE [Bacteroidota bacterium]